MATQGKPSSILHVDFETRSTRDLPAVGLFNYADPTVTSVLCMAWAFDDEPVELWTPYRPNFPNRLGYHIADGGEFWAHNATFEFEIWNKVFCPQIPMKLEQMVCT